MARSSVPGAHHFRQMARRLRGGAVIAYPTEGVFGLGCDPQNDTAIEHILSLKRRDMSLGLILIAARESQLRHYFRAVDELQMEQVRSTWPGPVTWILPAAETLSRLISGGRDSVALRVSAHRGVMALCDAFGGAIVSTSANISGRSAATTRLGVRQRFGHSLDGIVGGTVGSLRGPSEIRDATNNARLIRKAK